MDDLLTHVRAVLAATPAHWRTLAEALAPALLNRPPAPGEWSAAQCLQHLLDAEREVFPVRVRCFLAGQDFPAFDPDAQGTVAGGPLDPRAAAAEFARRRADTLALLAGLTPADLPRQARHSELGPVTLEELLHEWAAHDLMHTVQAERALMQPFILGCGPWRKYFAGHTVNAAG